MAGLLVQSHTTPSYQQTDTDKWLQENNLSHLINKFKEIGLTIDELNDLSSEDIKEILIEHNLSKTDAIRISSKMKKHKPKQAIAIQPVIITVAETDALNALEQKIKSLKTNEHITQQAINNIEFELKQQKLLIKKRFLDIITHIEQRKDAILIEMNKKVDNYRKEFNKKLNYLKNYQKNLISIKDQVQNNINKSGIHISSTEYTDKLTIRSNKNVNLIDTTLLQIDGDKTNISPTGQLIFNIQSSNIKKNISSWGNVQIVYTDVNDADDDEKKSPIQSVQVNKNWITSELVEFNASDNMVITTKHDSLVSDIRKSYCISTNKWNKDTQNLSLKILNHNYKDMGFGIGIVTVKKSTKNYWLFDSVECGQSYHFYFANSTSGKSGIYELKRGKSWLVEKYDGKLLLLNNSIIQMTINCNNWTLEFKMNGKQIGKAKKIQQNTYFPAVAFNHSNIPPQYLVLT